VDHQITNNSLSYSYGPGYGGVIYSSYIGLVNITNNSSVSGNTAIAGGAIYATELRNLYVSSSTLCNNTATAGSGGAVAASSAVYSITVSVQLGEWQHSQRCASDAHGLLGTRERPSEARCPSTRQAMVAPSL
jgi:predicted outer membrane repeat protein